MKKIITYNFVLIMLIFFTLEVVLRTFKIIELQGFNKDSVYFENDTVFHKPNLLMKIMGKKSKTDPNGFRIPLEGYRFDDNRDSILILGDSVSFGVSVVEKNTFIGRVRDKIDKNLLNTSVAGHRLIDYSYLIKKYNKDFPFVKKVIIFLCLNDIITNDGIVKKKNFNQINHFENDNFFLKFLRNDFFIKLNFFLRDKSTLFNLVKSLSTNTVERYYNYILPYYNEEFYLNNYQKNIQEIISFAENKNLEVNFVLLPYKFQIYNSCEDSVMSPQFKINKLFKSFNYQLFDFSKDFCDKKSSKNLFLNFDPMHLSSNGHEFVSKLLIKNGILE